MSYELLSKSNKLQIKLYAITRNIDFNGNAKSNRSQD